MTLTLCPHTVIIIMIYCTWSLCVSAWLQWIWRDKITQPRTDSQLGILLQLLFLLLLESISGKPVVHVLWPRSWALEAGKNGRRTALKAVDEHQRDAIACEIEPITTRTAVAGTNVFHPKTNKWNKQSKSIVKLTVSLHQASVGWTKSVCVRVRERERERERERWIWGQTHAHRREGKFTYYNDRTRLILIP